MHFIHLPDRAVVRVAGEPTVDAVEELVDTLCRVYFYSLIEIGVERFSSTTCISLIPHSTTRAFSERSSL